MILSKLRKWRKGGKRRAFTLVEMLAVVALVGILFVVFIPRIDFATDKVKEAGVMVDMRSYLIAFQQANIEESNLLGLSGSALCSSINEYLDPELQVKYSVDNGFSIDKATDPWGQPYKFIYSNNRCYVVSSGPDKKFSGTNDDIAYDLTNKVIENRSISYSSDYLLISYATSNANNLDNYGLIIKYGDDGSLESYSPGLGGGLNSSSGDIDLPTPGGDGSDNGGSGGDGSDNGGSGGTGGSGGDGSDNGGSGGTGGSGGDGSDNGDGGSQTPQTKYTVTYMADSNGTVNESKREFTKGSNLTFPTATANDPNEYIFDKWIDVSTTNTVATSTTVNSNMSVKALFKPNPESTTIRVSYITDGNGEVFESSRTFDEGDTMTFPSTYPNIGYTFDKWVNSETNETVTTQTIVNESVTVKAVFKAQEFIVTYLTDGNGTVSEQTRSFSYGDNLTLPDVTPNAGYRLVKWVNITNNSEVTESTVLNSPITIKAIFEKIGFTVTYGVDGSGSLSESSRQFSYGDRLTFPTPTPDSGHEFVKWIDSTGNTVTESTVVTSNMSVTAVFAELNICTVTYSTEGGGTVSESSRTFRLGETLTFPTYTADTDMMFCKWVNASTGAEVKTTTEIVGNMEIKAVFANIASVLQLTAYENGWSIDDFYNSLSITDLIIPSHYQGKPMLITIDNQYLNGAFSGDKLLKSVILPDTIKIIGDNAFYNCTNLEYVKIPNSVTRIGEYTFYKCGSIKSIDIPNSVTNLGFSCFQDCTGLTSAEIPSSVTNLELSAYDSRLFYGCTGLKTVEINANIEDIPNGMFQGCTSLESVNIPASVTKIGQYAFYNCYMLELDIPSTVTNIVKDAFKNVYKITYYGPSSGSPWGAKNYNGQVFS